MIIAATIVVVAANVAAHLYLAKRLVTDLVPAGSPWRYIGTTLLACSAVLTAALMVSSPYQASGDAIAPFAAAGRRWVPVLAYLIAATAVCEPIRVLIRRHTRLKHHREAPGVDTERSASLDRRGFLDRTLAISAVAVAGALGARSMMSSIDRASPHDTESPPPPLVLAPPFRGTWIVRNSPARRIPSHGTDLLGTRYAIDFVAVDSRRRTATGNSWRTYVGAEPPNIFVGFGKPILAPISGVVAAVHDGEHDHDARRSQIALLPYMLGQARRLRKGVGAIAGNYVIIRASGTDAYVGLVHLQAGSIQVHHGQTVAEGMPIARCGNSGNSTQPHVHVQAMDRMDLANAQGLAIAFRDFREWPAGRQGSRQRTMAIPDEGSVVEAGAPGLVGSRDHVAGERRGPDDARAGN